MGQHRQLCSDVAECSMRWREGEGKEGRVGGACVFGKVPSLSPHMKNYFPEIMKKIFPDLFLYCLANHFILIQILSKIKTNRIYFPVDSLSLSLPITIT